MIATTSELIETFIGIWMSLGQSITVGTSNFRTMTLHFAQRRGMRMWIAYQWPWTYQEADVTHQAVDGEIVTIPPDYHSLSKEGQFYTENGAPYNLRWRTPIQLFAMLRRGSTLNRRGLPLFYTELLSTLDEDGNYIGGRRLFAAPRPSTDTALRLIYKTIPPTLVDDTDGSQLEAFPPEYRDTILIDGMIADWMDKQGDGRSAEYEAKFIRGMAEGWESESQGQNSVRRWGARYGARVHLRSQGA